MSMTHQHHNTHHATTSSILALDVGDRRVGVALASTTARLAHPHQTLERGEHILEELQALAASEHVTVLVVGLPRNLEGRATAQTAAVEAFAHEVQRVLGLTLHWQDEAVTSRQAEAELEARGKPYEKGDIDALSATYILEDFLRDNPEVKS